MWQKPRVNAVSRIQYDKLCLTPYCQNFDDNLALARKLDGIPDEIIQDPVYCGAIRKGGRFPGGAAQPQFDPSISCCRKMQGHDVPRGICQIDHLPIQPDAFRFHSGEVEDGVQGIQELLSMLSDEIYEFLLLFSDFFG